MTHTSSPDGGPILTVKQEQLAIAGLIVWVLAWGLRTCLLDTELAMTDNLLGHANQLHGSISDGNVGDAWSMLFAGGFHPPLPSLVATLLASLMGFGPETVRISCLLLHPVAMVQVYWLSRALCSNRNVAAFACLLTATVPMIFGWFRSDFPEPLTTVFVLATLHALLVTDLRRPWPAVRLGMLTGLGALAKLSFMVFILLPAIYFAFRRIRDARSLAMAGLALLSALLVCGWWYIPSFQAILTNLHLSTGGAQEGAHLSRIVDYLWMPAGNLILTLAAVAGAAIAFCDKAVDRPRLVLLLLCWGGSYLMFLLVFDFWARYILPLLPLSCVLTALAWGKLAGWLGPRARLAVLGCVTLVMLGSFTFFNLSSSHHSRQFLGLIFPSTRVFSIFDKLINRLNVQPSIAFVTSNSGPARELVIRKIRAAKRAFPTLIPIARAAELVKGGENIYRVHVIRQDAAVAGRPVEDVRPGQLKTLVWMKGHTAQIESYRNASYEIRLTVINRDLKRHGE